MPFVDAGDLRAHYIERGEGVPVVMIHGNWGTASWWELVLARLPAGMHGIAYDMRGRGKTRGPDNDYTMPQMAADLRAVADALGLDKFHLIGHSLGSAVAMQFMLESPERVLTLTAVAPAWVDGMPAAFNVASSQKLIKKSKALYAGAIKAMAPTVLEDEYWQRLVAEGHKQRIEAAVRNLPALVAWRPGDNLRARRIPALVVAGSADPLTGGANSERAAAALGAKLVVMKGVGHSPIVEAPDDFMRIWTSWIERSDYGK